MQLLSAQLSDVIQVCSGPRALLLIVLLTLMMTSAAREPAYASWASRFSIATGELYSDNIFFSEDKKSDLVTQVTPALSLAYKPTGQTRPTFTMNLSSAAEVFASHSDLNNVGDNIWMQSRYLYPYSPRLEFTISDALLRRSESRTGGSGDFGSRGGIGGGVGGVGGGVGGAGGGLGGGGSELGGAGVSGLGGFGGVRGLGGGGSNCGGSSSIRSERNSVGLDNRGAGLEDGDLVSRGERLEHQLSGDASFRYSPITSFRGGYCWNTIWFFDQGGKETAHTVNVEGTYRRWRQHNLRARYQITFLRSRDGKNDILHDFDIGDDFLSQREIRLTPTLTVRAATGISLASSGSGNSKFRLEHKFNLDVIKVWRTMQLTVGVRRGLTGSYGVSGPSFTTHFFGRFLIYLTERLQGGVGAEYAMFDAEDAEFKTLRAFLGLQYWLTSWLSTNVMYSYQRVEPDSGAAATGVLGSSTIDSNIIFITLAVHFDLWPRFGLATGGDASLLGPAGGLMPGGRGLRRP